jgi:crotonobetainyl-CoA:carnitine CoA-transferase CaiB-like acyl-CoA transferase
VDDPHFATVDERRWRSAELAGLLREGFAAHDYEHWRKTMATHGVSFGVICRPQDVPDDEQAVACGAVVDTAIPKCRYAAEVDWIMVPVTRALRL